MAVPKSEKHKPNRLENYFRAHDGKLKELQGMGFVKSVDLITDPRYPKKAAYMKMEGKIELDGGLRMEVRKLLRVRTALPDQDKFEIYTVEYSYSLIKAGHYTIFRYCSPHDDFDDTPAHHKQHHKHVFDPNSGDPVEIKVLTEDEWPTLGEALDEAKKFV